jgi:hypothetical protein
VRSVLDLLGALQVGSFAALLTVGACSPTTTTASPTDTLPAGDDGDDGGVDADATIPDVASDRGTDAAQPKCPGIGSAPNGADCWFNADCCSGACNLHLGDHGLCDDQSSSNAGACLPGGTSTSDLIGCCSGFAQDQICTGSTDASSAKCRGIASCRANSDCCTRCCLTKPGYFNCQDPMFCQ